MLIFLRANDKDYLLAFPPAIFRQNNSNWSKKTDIYGFCLHFFRTVDSLNQSHNEKEKYKFNADLQLNNLRFKLDQEMDARGIAERLCNQLKDQLGRCEKKLTRYDFSFFKELFMRPKF